MTKVPPVPKPKEIPAHYKPKVAIVQQLGYMGSMVDLEAIQLAYDGGASVYRSPVGWMGFENPHTGEMATPEKITAGLKLCEKLGMMPMLVAAQYGTPSARTEAKPKVKIAAAVGDTSIVLDAPIPGYVPGHDFAQLTAEHKPGGHNVAKRLVASEFNAEYGAPLIAENGSTYTLAAKLTTALKVGDELIVNRLRYSPPADRTYGNPSRVAYVRWVEFLMAELNKLAVSSYICIGNEPPWGPDPWLDMRAFYEVPPPGMSSGGMHTLLREFFGTKEDGSNAVPCPARVRLVSGATDTGGGPQSLLKQYQPEVVGNKEGNYIAQPTPKQLAAFVAEGIHPYGGHHPEAASFDEEFKTLIRMEEISAFTAVLQHQQTWGRQHGYSLQTFATECGFGRQHGINGDYQDGLDKQARYLIRRILSLWMMNVPMGVIYDLAPDGFASSVVGRNADGTAFLQPAYLGLKHLIETMRSLGGGLGVAGTLPVFQSITGNTYEPITGAFTGVKGSAAFVWQDSWTETKGNDPEVEGGWASLSPPSLATVTFSHPDPAKLDVRTVRTQESVPITPVAGGFTIPVSDDAISLLSLA